MRILIIVMLLALTTSVFADEVTIDIDKRLQEAQANYQKVINQIAKLITLRDNLAGQIVLLQELKEDNSVHLEPESEPVEEAE